MIYLLDTTLREGEQTWGIELSPLERVEIARAVDQVGVAYIEAGNPGVSNYVNQGVEAVVNANLNAIVGAHTLASKKHIDIARRTGAPLIGMFHTVLANRLDEIYEMSLTQVYQRIYDAVSYLRKNCPDTLIRYTPEDAARSNFDDVVKAIEVACDAGDNKKMICSVADTTGYFNMLEGNDPYNYILRLKERLDHDGYSPILAVHMHNDKGMADINALRAAQAAIDYGFDLNMDAAILRQGERAGITDLAIAAMNLRFMGQTQYDLTKLQDAYTTYSRIKDIAIPKNWPGVGEDSFTHIGGVHADSARKQNGHYAVVQPELFGRSPNIGLGHQSGRANILFAAEQEGITLDEQQTDRLVLMVKNAGTNIKVTKDVFREMLASL